MADDMTVDQDPSSGDQDLNIDLNEETLDQSESLDSDELGERVGDDGYTPPDAPAVAQRFGTTADEEREGESLDAKLGEERPDVPLADLDVAPVVARPDTELDETIDERITDEPPVDTDLTADGLEGVDHVLTADEVIDLVGDGPVVRDASPTAPDEVYPA